MTETGGESVSLGAPRKMREFTFVAAATIANNPARIVQER
jgi:hypothetical protein